MQRPLLFRIVAGVLFPCFAIRSVGGSRQSCVEDKTGVFLTHNLGVAMSFRSVSHFRL